MIWSFTKIAIFVLLIAAVTLGVGYVIEAGGEIRVQLSGIELTLTPIAAMIGLVVFLISVWILFRLLGLILAVLRFFNGDETAITRYFNRNRERRGFEALADGMMAIAAGEGKVAMTKAAKAERYLQRPELTLLLSAQAAEMTGETKKAEASYRSLLADDRTRFAGIQGLLKQKLVAGETETALKLAEKAFALRPRHENTLNTLFSLQSEKKDWSGARKTLEAKLHAKALPRDVHARRDAVLALALAREKIEAGEIDAGALNAFQANRLSPDLVPAAVLAAEMHILKNAPRKAVKILKNAWATTPHPDLAAAFANIMPDETPVERINRFQTLVKANENASETKLLSTELALVAEDFPAARKALGDLADAEPTTRSLTLMAAIERGEGAADKIVRGWLTKALHAPRGPQWVCASCYHIHPIWAPICENCASFDTLEWVQPANTEDANQATSDTLALIEGAPDAIEEHLSDVLDSDQEDDANPERI